MCLYKLASRICPTRSKKIDCRLNSRTDKAFGCWGWAGREPKGLRRNIEEKTAFDRKVRVNKNVFLYNTELSTDPW